MESVRNRNINWQPISALFLGSFSTFAILYCMQPLIPVFSEHFHIAPAVASLTVSLSTGFLAVFMIFAAWLSDAVGRKNIMLVALFASGVLILSVAFSDNLVHFLIVRAAQGILLSGFPAIAMAYVNEEFEHQQVGLVMGIYVSGTSIGGMFGRVMVSALTEAFSWHIALLVTGIISLLVSLWFWRSLPPSRNFVARKRPLGEMLAALIRCLANPVLVALFLIGFFLLGGFVVVYNYIGFILMAPPYNLSHTAVGSIFLLYLTGTFSSALAGRLADKLAGYRVIGLSILVMLTGCLLTLAEPLLLKIFGIALFTFGFFGGHSVASGLVAKCTPRDKAQASSLYLLFYYLGSSLVGTAGGSFLSWYGWRGVVFCTGISLVGALLLTVSLKSMETGE